MLLWLAGGILSWVLSSLLFSYLLSPFAPPAYDFFREAFSSTVIVKIALFAFLQAPYYGISFLSAIILSSVTGIQKTWLLAFIIGATAYTIYISMAGILFYSDYYDTLPSWVLHEWLQSMISSLVMIPLLVWAGARVGILIKQKKTSNDSSAESTSV